MSKFFVQFNPNLDIEGTMCAILFNYRINCYNQKFWRILKNGWIIKVEKCNFPLKLFVVK